MRVNNKFVLIIAVILVIMLVSVNKGEKTEKAVIDNLDELYEQIANMALSFDSREKFTLSFEPNMFVYEDAMKIVEETDPYQAANSMAYSWVSKQVDNEQWELTIEIDYMGTKREIKKSDKRIKELCEKMEGMTDYEKVKAIHDYVILYCDYGWDGIAFKSIEQGPYWTLFPGLAVCNGYALTFYRTMQMCDIPVTFEVGDNHAWNTVCVDGSWYNIDLTWDDLGDEVSYEYFLKDEKDFKGHHHSNVNARSSREVTGKTAQENYDIFPDYKFAYRCYLIFMLLLPFIILILLIVIHNKRKAIKRRAWARRQMESINEEQMYRNFLHNMGPSNSGGRNIGDDIDSDLIIPKDKVQFLNDDFDEFQREHYDDSEN